MDKRMGMIASLVNVCAVAAFALCLLLGFTFGCYLASMFIALSFVPMMGAFAAKGASHVRAVGNTAMLFAGMYAAVILVVYFTQLTTVRLESLDGQATSLLDYSTFGLFFNLDMLGYCLMSLATFFAGLTIGARSKADKALKYLLMIHGVFAIGCLLMPMLGAFNSTTQGANWIGTALLCFWSLYFIPIGILAFWHFRKPTSLEVND